MPKLWLTHFKTRIYMKILEDYSHEVSVKLFASQICRQLHLQSPEHRKWIYIQTTAKLWRRIFVNLWPQYYRLKSVLGGLHQRPFQDNSKTLKANLCEFLTWILSFKICLWRIMPTTTKLWSQILVNFLVTLILSLKFLFEELHQWPKWRRR